MKAFRIRGIVRQHHKKKQCVTGRRLNATEPTWQLGQGSDGLNAKNASPAVSDDEQRWQIILPAQPVLLGKTVLTTPAGREGLAPKIIFGQGMAGFSLTWSDAGVAEVMLPVTSNGKAVTGTFTFRIRAVALLRQMTAQGVVYAGVFDDLKGNGLPGQEAMLPPGQTPGVLRAMFAGEGRHGQTTGQGGG